MINVAFLCAIFLGDLSCTPYRDMETCLSAERGLFVALIEQSGCAPVEIRDPRPAPHSAPMPKPRPSNGIPA